MQVLENNSVRCPVYVSGFNATRCHGATSLSRKAWRPSAGLKIWPVWCRNLPVMIKIASHRQSWQLFLLSDTETFWNRRMGCMWHTSHWGHVSDHSLGLNHIYGIKKCYASCASYLGKHRLKLSYLHHLSITHKYKIQKKSYFFLWVEVRLSQPVTVILPLFLLCNLINVFVQFSFYCHVIA